MRLYAIKNGEQLIDICCRDELRINNTLFQHKEQHKYTFSDTQGQNSMTNYIITNRNQKY